MISKALVVIDTDLLFLERFKRKLSDLGLLAEFSLHVIELHVSTSDEAVHQAVEEVENLVQSGQEIEGIFVDVVIIESGDLPTDLSGEDVARRLRAVIPRTPLIAITRHISNHRLVSELSFERCFDGIILKGFIESESFKRTDLLSFLEKGKQNASSALEGHGGLADVVATGTTKRPAAELKHLVADGTQIASQHAKLSKELVSRSIYNPYDIAIICALQDPEFEKLKNVDTEHLKWKLLNLRDSHFYWTTEIETAHGKRFSMVAGVPSFAGLTSSAILATKMVLMFQPRVLLLVGIAAGTRDSGRDYGDILIPQQAIDYSSGKIVQMPSKGIRFEPDPHPVSIPQPFLALFQNKSKEYLSDIEKLWPGPKPKSALNIHIGPIASGDVVVASSEKVKSIREHWRKLIGVEMEAYAVYRAAYEASAEPPHFAAIKAVCDFAEQTKTDDWQDYAAFTAAQYCYRILKNDIDSILS
jgi:nucleoside phosphorylase